MVQGTRVIIDSGRKVGNASNDEVSLSRGPQVGLLVGKPGIDRLWDNFICNERLRGIG